MAIFLRNILDIPCEQNRAGKLQKGTGGAKQKAAITKKQRAFCVGCRARQTHTIPKDYGLSLTCKRPKENIQCPTHA